MACQSCKDKFEKQEERIRILEGVINLWADENDKRDRDAEDVQKRVIYLEDKVNQHLP